MRRAIFEFDEGSYNLRFTSGGIPNGHIKAGSFTTLSPIAYKFLSGGILPPVLRSSSKSVVRAIALVAIACLGVLSILGDSGDIPRRKITPPPAPSGLTESPLPSKKARDAAALRRAAEVMEDAVRRDLEALGADISNQIAAFNFTNKQFSLKVENVSFMELGTNLIAQVRFSYLEK